MKYSFLPIFFSISILISCGNHNKNQAAKTHELVKSRKIELQLDAQSPITSQSLWLFEDNGVEYISYAKSKFSYSIYNLSKMEKQFEINLIKEGPNAVPDVSAGLFPIDLNNFILGGMMTPTIYHIDSNAKVLNKSDYKLTKYPYGSNTDAGATLYGNRPFAFKNGKIYGGDFFFGPWGRWDKDHIFSKNLFIEIDTLNGGKGDFLPITMPKSAWENGVRLILPLYEFANNKVILSNPQEHKIYVSDFNGTTKVYQARSKYVDSFEEYDLSFSPPEYFKYYTRNGAYNSIIYDKYRDLYYRVFIHPYKPNEEIDWLKAKKHPKKVSIVILDKDFKKIGETLLPKNKHYIYNIFVGKAGLYISNSHFDNPNLKEDILSFTIYKPEVIDNEG